jgi:DNA-binding response OmpR family regulator/REP element-mobilizing transposase RayT
MAMKVLVATPVRSFGELISQALQELNYFPLFVAGTAEALSVAQNEEFSIAVLDSNMLDPDAASFAAELRSQKADLHIIYIRLDEDSDKPVDMDSDTDIELPSPFYLPDLLEAVIELDAGTSAAAFSPISTSTVQTEMPPVPSELAWLKDVNRAAQYLTRLSLEADAHAALIIRRTRIWAYAGQLSQSAAEELAQYAGQHWANGDGSDLARFVRLSADNGEYMLYATGLGSGFVLALAYETEMPFSKMRSQTGELARRLMAPSEAAISEPKVVSPPPEPPPSKPEGEPAPQKSSSPLDIDDFSSDDWIPENEFPEDDLAEWANEAAVIERQAAMFEDLLASLDIPDPDGGTEPYSLQTETGVRPKVEVEPHKPVIIPEPRTEAPRQQEVEPPPVSEPLTPAEVHLEAETPAVHDLAFACVLLPRLPAHHLTGELPALLNRNMERLCLAFGWRLEHLAIRPQYLHWVVSVGPDVPAAEVIREIREHTSTLIFEAVPRLEKENPSGDFWAQGFMVIHGRRSLAGRLVDDFIRQTRARQGLETN